MREPSGQEIMAMASMDRANRSGSVAWPRSRRIAREPAERLRFQGGTEAPARTRPGDNRKQAVGRPVATGADFLILDEPTRGIDIGARVGACLLVQSLAEAGAGIVTISPERPESMHVAHRIIVMSGGRVRDETPLPALGERHIPDAGFAALIRARDSGEAIRDWPEIHDQDS